MIRDGYSKYLITGYSGLVICTSICGNGKPMPF